MESERLLNAEEVARDAPRSLRYVQTVGYLAFFGFMGALALAIVQSFDEVGSIWWILAMVVLGYLTADLLSGIVHFLADNFGSPDTPFLGQGFVLPFRQHHVDPLGITRHGFFIANGNNALVCLPILIPVVVLVPVESSAGGYHAGVFVFVMLLAVFLTNQTHKWAHMETVPRPVAWLQRAGVILAKDHHDIHHTSPFDTHYCITVGAWNRLFERHRIFDRLERVIRRWIPGTDPRTRVEQDAARPLPPPVSTSVATSPLSTPSLASPPPSTLILRTSRE